MADEKLIFKGQVFAWGKYRVSTRANQFTLPLARADVDLSAIEDLADRHGKGPLSHQMGFQGHASNLFEQRVLQDLEDDDAETPATLLMGDGTVGSLAYFGLVSSFSNALGGTRGESKSFNLSLMFQTGLYWGVTLENQVGQAGFGPGANNGTWHQVSVPSATEEVVATWHLTDPPGVTTGGGETYDGRIEVASDGAGTGAETILDFTQLSDVGAELKRVAGAGPAGKDFYRSVITPTGAGALCHPIVALQVRTADGA